MGPQGDAGPQGAQGPAGGTGLQGLAGPQGPAGSTGAQGDAGPQGLTGPQGTQGPAGDTGPQGDAGPQGLTGPQGPQGSTTASYEYFAGAPLTFLPLSGAVIGNILSGTLATQASAINREDIHPFVSSFNFSIDLCYLSVSTLTAGTAYVVIYGCDANGRPTGAPTLSASMDTTTTGTKSAAITYSFQMGKMYWIGSRTSAACTLRVAQIYSSFNLTWSTAATPARTAVLRQTIAVTDVTAYPAYSNALLTAAMPALVLMRIV